MSETPDLEPTTIDQLLAHLERHEGQSVWRIKMALAIGATDSAAGKVLKLAMRELGPDATIGDVEDVLLIALCWLRLFSTSRLAHHWLEEEKEAHAES